MKSSTILMPNSISSFPRTNWTKQDLDKLPRYTAILASYPIAFMGFSILRKRMRKELPERIAPYDLLILGAASYRLSRIITKERVAAPLRSPVTKQSFDDSGLTNQEQPRGEGAERVLGELVTCPFCVGSWVAAGFTYSLVLAPRHTRFIAGILAVDAASGLLHCVFSKMRS